jgi:dehydrogenase
VVEPFAGGGGCAGHAGYLAVGGVQAVTEREEQGYADAHTHGGRADDEHDKTGCGAGGGDGGDSVGSDAQGHGGGSKVAGDATVDPAGVGGHANTGLLSGLQGTQGAGEGGGKSR